MNQDSVGLPPGPGAPPAVSDHQLLSRIGEGGYGEVWLARNNALPNLYRAVKVLYRRHFANAEPYECEFTGIQEYEPLSREHNGLTQVLHVARDDDAGYFYYVMELADDQNDSHQPGSSEIDPSRYRPKTLSSELKRHGRLPLEECLEIGLAVADALEYLHQRGKVHRDIKPSNIIFVGGKPKVADIGLVTTPQPRSSPLGTAGYLAPEGSGKESADIYSLGALLFKMNTGLDYPSLPARWGEEPSFERLRKLNEIALTALEPKEKRRYRTAAEIRLALHELKHEVQLKAERLRRGLLLIVGFLLTVLLYQGVNRQTERAEERARLRQSRLALRQARLAQARLQRQGSHLAGWSGTNWALIQQAAAIRAGPDVLEQAAGALAGWDAEPEKTLPHAAGGSAAFADDGRLLVGGTLGTPALLIDASGAKTELALRAEGPVGWSAEGVPLQFSAPSNVCLLHEVMTGQVRQHFALAPGERVHRTVRPVLAMSAHGDRVAAAVGGGIRPRLLVWDAVSGAGLGEAIGYFRALAFSEDALLLAAGETNGNIAVYSLPGMAKALDLPPPAGALGVHCLALARDRLVRDADPVKETNWLIAASYKGGAIVVWDLDTRLPRAVCRGSFWSVTALAFHPDGLTLVSGGRDHDVRFWDVMSGQLLLRILRDEAYDVRALLFNRQGTRLAWATEANPPPDASEFWKTNASLEEFPRNPSQPPTVALWDLVPQRGVQVLRGFTTTASCVWFSPNNRLVAAVSHDWRVAVWDHQAGRLLHLFEVPPGTFPDSAGGCFDAASERFAFAAGTQARLYEVPTGRVLERWTLPEPGLTDRLQFDRAGRLLFLRRSLDTVPDPEKRWRLYELPSQRPPVVLREQSNTNGVPYDTAFAADGERFFVMTLDRVSKRPAIRAYDVGQAEAQWQVTVPGMAASEVYLDPTGNWFAYELDQSRRSQLLRLPGFKESGSTPDHCVAIAPTGDQFAVRIGQGFWICDRRGPHRGVPLGSDWVPRSEPAFSLDGRFFAWGTEEGVVLVADLAEVQRRLAALHR